MKLLALLDFADFSDSPRNINARPRPCLAIPRPVNWAS